MEQLLSGVCSILPQKSKCALEVQHLQTQIGVLSISSSYNAENADATALLADLQSQQLGEIQKRNHLEREEQKREDGSWTIELFSEGKDTCVCTEQVDRPVLVLALLSLRRVNDCQGLTG